MAKVTGIEAMAVGTANGIDFSLKDLNEIARAFKEQRLSGRLPVKLGHHDDSTQPAQGWIVDMRVEGDRLLVDIDDVPEELAQQVREGRWRFVSMELLRNAERRGKKYAWIPTAIALLGAATPAFDWLAGLADKFDAAVAGFTFERKFAFARETGSADDRLRAENARLQQQLIHAEFEAAITSGRILPRDREAFKRRYGESGTADDARQWIASSPIAPGFSSTQTTHAPPRQTYSRPDEELSARTFERMRFERKENGRELTFLEASRLVIREDRELAQQYLDMPTNEARGR